MDAPNHHQVGGRGGFSKPPRPSASASNQPPSSTPYTLTGPSAPNMPPSSTPYTLTGPSAPSRPPSSTPYTLTGQGMLNAGFLSDMGIGQVNAAYQPSRGDAEHHNSRRQQDRPQRAPTGIAEISSKNGSLYPKLEALDGDHDNTEIHSRPETRGFSCKARLPSFAVRYMHGKKAPQEGPRGDGDPDEIRNEPTIQITRSPSHDLPKSEPLCQLKMSRRVVYAVTVAVLIACVLLLIILSATLTKSSSPPPTPKTSSTTKGTTWTTEEVTTMTTGLTSSTIQTTTTTIKTGTTEALPNVTATYLMNCTIPKADSPTEEEEFLYRDFQPYIECMCWLSDTKLVLADSALRILIANIDISNKECSIVKIYNVANRTQEMECSDRGEVFVKTDADDFVVIYKENGDPKEEWKPKETNISLNTMGINAEHIVTADYYNIAVYDKYRQFLHKRERVSKLKNIVDSYLSTNDLFWCSPDGETLRVYNLGSELVKSVNVKSHLMDGTGDYVFLLNDVTHDIHVYTQEGIHVQVLDMGDKLTIPDTMAIRKRQQQQGSIMAIWSAPYGLYKIYQLSI